MTPALELNDLKKFFGSVHAVDGLSLKVPEGSLFGLIGPNGAGKTTTFSLLAGFLKPTAGEIKIRGETLPPGVPRVSKLVALPQDANLPARAKPVEALAMLARLAGLDARTAEQRSRAALDRVDIGGPMFAQRIGNLSHGQRRRVAIATTLLGDDEVILLDEPTAGLDPIAAAELRALIKDLRGKRTLVLSSHNLAEVEQLCDHAAIIAQGKLVSAGSMDQLKQAGSLVQVLLGAPLANVQVVLQTLRGVLGVKNATAAADAKTIDLDVEDDGHGSADRVVNEVLKKLIEHGAAIRSVERGKSLEQRFLEDARR